ncbi:MAG: hypothetical protein ACC608_11320 [Anaerofustis sp.]
MKNQKKQKTKAFFILGIVFGVLALVGFVGNLIYAISNISYYVAYGYALSAVLPSYLYQVLQPVAALGGISAILFALNVIINRMPIPASDSFEIPAMAEMNSNESEAEETLVEEK